MSRGKSTDAPDDEPAPKTRPLPASTIHRVKRGTLSVSGGPAKGQEIALDDGDRVIGSGSAADIVLADDTVSGRHCEVLLRGERAIVRDLGSRNGVIINGVRVIEAELAPGMTLKLGNSWLELSTSEADLLVSEADAFAALYGKSAAMRAIFAQIPALAGSPAPLLLEGETGTGKDLTAEAVHQASPRADAPFIVFDCGAVAPNLVEAELFGHEKQAFTGADQARLGLVEAAQGGTLVLDEIGELPLDLQPKLLRMVEKKEIRRIGATASISVDVRIIACTHRSLRAEIKAGRFREDLYFRLSALRLRLPSLRERPEDVPGLIDRLLAQRGAGLRFDQLPENDRALLLGHRWPGNVRELRNAVERLVTVRGAPMFESEAGTGAHAVSSAWLTLPEARQEAQERFERDYVARALQHAQGSATEAAKLAGVSRQFLQRLIRKYQLR